VGIYGNRKGVRDKVDEGGWALESSLSRSMSVQMTLGGSPPDLSDIVD
jgi:hypothetical protein